MYPVVRRVFGFYKAVFGQADLLMTVRDGETLEFELFF